MEKGENGKTLLAALMFIFFFDSLIPIDPFPPVRGMGIIRPGMILFF